MRHIPVGEAQVGDRIAEAIYSENGRVLLPVGARLSENLAHKGTEGSSRTRIRC